MRRVQCGIRWRAPMAIRHWWTILRPSSISWAHSENVSYAINALTKTSQLVNYIVLRFGKGLDVFYASLRAIHYPDFTIRVTLTMSKLSQALFLLADHLLWLARTGLTAVDPKKWSRIANKYWLFSIIMNLCRDLYEIMRVLDLHKASCSSGITRCKIPARINTPADFKKLALHSYGLVLGHKDIVVDTVKNVCDFFIPLTALGYTSLTPRTIGMLGAISSMAGLWALLEPTAKLTPA